MRRYRLPATVKVRHLLHVQRPRRPYDEAFRRRLGVFLAVILLRLLVLLARTWHHANCPRRAFSAPGRK